MTKDVFIKEVRDAEAMLYHISKCSEIEPNMLHKINHDKINELKKSIFKDMEDIERKIIVFIEKNLDFCK